MSGRVLSILLLLTIVFTSCKLAAPDSIEVSQPYSETNEQNSQESAGLAEPTAQWDVEIFSWWAGSGESLGLKAMIDVLHGNYPDIEFIDIAVTKSTGTNTLSVMTTQLQIRDVPKNLSDHTNWELIGNYAGADQLEPVNFLYEENGWLEVMPETLIPLISKDGDIYSVPVNIHRANVMWYNPQILEDNDITVPESFDEWITAMETLDAAGVLPLALGEQWTVMHLMETILLASLGPDAYNGLWNGATDWSSLAVLAALEDFNTVLGFTNPNFASHSWQDAAQLVIDGDAAFNVMGDWAEGFFHELGKAPSADYGWTPVPGTGGTFQFLSDSFVLAKGTPHPDAAIAWLTVAGSKEGQDALSPHIGSIPARNDCERRLYGEYLQSAMDDWTTDTIVGSLTNGMDINNSWKSELDTALSRFLVSSDVARFHTELVAAYNKSGITQTGK
jgi:glucose/mannose transport system substrate-binding protein